MTVLFENVDIDATSDELAPSGGAFIVNVRANEYGGAKVEIQTRAKNDSLDRWSTLTNGTFQADATKKMDFLGHGIVLRAVISEATGATDSIFVDIVQ